MKNGAVVGVGCALMMACSMETGAPEDEQDSVEVAGAEHLFGCFEQFALYGAIVFLYLPAGIAAAVVFEGDFVAQLSEE